MTPQVSARSTLAFTLLHVTLSAVFCISRALAQENAEAHRYRKTIETRVNSRPQTVTKLERLREDSQCVACPWACQASVERILVALLEKDGARYEIARKATT